MALSARGPSSRELSINVTLDGINDRSAPPSPYEVVAPSSTLKSITTLAEAWEDARRRFQERTKQSIDGRSVDIDHFLEDWASQCKVDDSEKARKKKKILGVIQNIIDGINVVGGIVAQGVSMTFGVAGPCFNALSFLLNIPRSIKHVYDTLLELFEEVENFLVRFKILKRIDSSKMLPNEMVLSASRMLISFVDICGLSYKLLDKHAFQTALKAAFLNSDSGVSAALSDFRRMAQSLDSLTNTVALQNIFEIGKTTKETNGIIKEDHVTIKNVDFNVDRISKTLEQTTNDDRTRRAIRSRLTVIEKKIYRNEEQTYARGDRAAEMRPEFVEDLLSDTHNILEESQEFCTWRDAPPRSGRAAFLLEGPSGSGKSRMLEVFKKTQDDLRQKADKDEPSIYVAYFMFGGLVNKDATSQIPFALRNMAVQVAEQSTAYAKELEGVLQADKTGAIRQEDIIENLWKALKLSSFKTKTLEATMYLLFDGIEQETANSVNKLLSLFTGRNAEQAKERDSVSVRAILTIDPERQKVDSSIPSIDMSTATRALVKAYTIRELKRHGIFQSSDKKSIKRRDRIIHAIGSSDKTNQDTQGAWNFKDVKLKLEHIKTAIQDDASSEELDKILQDETGQILDPKAKEAVKHLARSLSAREISQVNQMLPWLLYSVYSDCLEVEELEAVLFLAHNSDSLQSIATKVGGRFRQLFYRAGIYVRLRPEIEKVFRETEEQSQHKLSTKKPLISLQLSIQNAEESTVQQFIWQLNEQVSTGRFNFESYASASHTMISVNKLDGHISITKLCLKLLNDGWQDETEVLVRYAREFLPRHFIYLADNIEDISISDRTAISQSFVNFLSDPYRLSYDRDRHFGHGEDWLANSESAIAMRAWLEATKEYLQAREKRWLSTALKPSEGRLGYLRQLACAVGSKWARQLKEHAMEGMNSSFGVLVSNSLESNLFDWLNRYIENNVQDEDKESSEVNPKTTTEPESLKNTNIPENAERTEAQLEHSDSHSGHSDTGEEERPPLVRRKTMVEASHAKNIKDAIDWLDKNEVVYRENGPFHINIGYTYLAYGEYDEADQHFKHAMEHDASKRQALTALGRLCYARGQKEEATVKLREALSMLELQKLQHGLKDDQNKILAELYRELAAAYGELPEQKLNEAINLYEKSLECHDDLDVRWRTLKMLCEVNQVNEIDRAVDLLEKFSYHGEENGGSGLSYALHRSTNDEPYCEQLELFIQAIEDTDMRIRIVQALSEAIRIAEVSEGPGPKAKLLYLRGLAVVKGSGTDQWLMAVDLWREALATVIPDDCVDWGCSLFLNKAAVGVAQHEFEQSVSRLSVDTITELSYEEREMAVQELKHNLENRAFSNPNVFEYRALLITNRYLVSLNMMLDRIDDARALLAEDMSTVLDMLSDDDDDNDVQGIWMLMAVLCSVGDKIGALSAFSLFDRQVQEPEVGLKGSERNNETPIQRIVANYVARCDCCRKEVTSNNPRGFWWCQYCADFDLCPDCHDSFVDAKLTSPRCRPDHKLIHLYHTKYTDDEVAGNNVKIDWEWQDVDGDFSRKGGRIVSLPEWLEELRVAWKVPKDSGDSRVQK